MYAHGSGKMDKRGAGEEKVNNPRSSEMIELSLEGMRHLPGVSRYAHRTGPRFDYGRLGPNTLLFGDERTIGAREKRKVLVFLN